MEKTDCLKEVLCCVTLRLPFVVPVEVSATTLTDSLTDYQDSWRLISCQSTN